jgi:hypothetical protein
MRQLRRIVAVIALASVVGACSTAPPAPERVSSPQFRIGQVWRYQTRPGEGASRVIIGRIERIEGIGRVVHVKLTDLKLMSSAAPGSVATILFHVPMREDWLAYSLTELTPERGDLEGFAEGYGTWLAAYRRGEAGVFAIPLSEVVRSMEQALDP